MNWNGIKRIPAAHGSMEVTAYLGWGWVHHKRPYICIWDDFKDPEPSASRSIKSLRSLDNIGPATVGSMKPGDILTKRVHLKRKYKCVWDAPSVRNGCTRGAGTRPDPCQFWLYLDDESILYSSQRMVQCRQVLRNQADFNRTNFVSVGVRSEARSLAFNRRPLMPFFLQFLIDTCLMNKTLSVGTIKKI